MRRQNDNTSPGHEQGGKLVAGSHKRFELGHTVIMSSDISAEEILEKEILETGRSFQSLIVCGKAQFSVQVNIFSVMSSSGKHVNVIAFPLIPHFFVKLGYTDFLFLFLLQNIACGCSLEPLTCTHNLCFEQK